MTAPHSLPRPIELATLGAFRVKRSGWTRQWRWWPGRWRWGRFIVLAGNPKKLRECIPVEIRWRGPYLAAHVLTPEEAAAWRRHRRATGYEPGLLSKGGAE